LGALEKEMGHPVHPQLLTRDPYTLGYGDQTPSFSLSPVSLSFEKILSESVDRKTHPSLCLMKMKQMK
jgi:hypothetical protein